MIVTPAKVMGEMSSRHHSTPGLLFVGILAVAAGVSYRFDLSAGPVNSISILDVMLISGGAFGVIWLILGRSVRVGDSTIFACLAIPALITAASILWTSDTTATIRALIVYMEGLVAYLVVINMLRGRGSSSVASCFSLFVVATVVTCILMYLGVPGFQPRIDSAALSEQNLRAYLERFSHPYIGASNNVASVLAFAIFPLAFCARRSQGPGLWYSRVALWMAVIALLLTLSRGVIAAVVLCSLGALIWSRKPSFAVLLRIVFVILIAAVVVYFTLQVFPALENNLQGRLSLLTLKARADLMLHVIDAIAKHPFNGWGGGAVPPYAPWLLGGAHNTYLENAMYFGVPLAMALSICLLMLPVRLYWLFRDGPPAAMQLCSLGLVCQLLIFLTETSFEGSTLKVIFYAFTGLSFVLLESEARVGVGSIAAVGPRVDDLSVGGRRQRVHPRSFDSAG